MIDEMSSKLTSQEYNSLALEMKNLREIRESLDYSNHLIAISLDVIKTQSNTINRLKRKKRGITQKLNLLIEISEGNTLKRPRRV